MAVILSAFPTLARQVATPVAGYTLVNGTGTIITWTAPNDGQNHRASLYATQDVTSLETGGAITISYTLPDSTVATHTVFPAGAAAGDAIIAQNFSVVVKPGTAVTLTQSSALTGGAAVLWAEIWGS